MYDVERQKKILDLLAKNKSMSVARLASLLFVSPPTVRRDLAALSQEGLVARTHGGAVLRDTSEKEIPLLFREDQNDHAKRVIAARARAYITDGSVTPFRMCCSRSSVVIPASSSWATARSRSSQRGCSTLA